MRGWQSNDAGGWFRLEIGAIKRKYIRRAFVYFVCIVAISYFGIVSYVDYRLADKDFADAYSSCAKVFSARGLYETAATQNSIESIGRAFARGAPGAEVDVRFDTELKQFIVSHDLPYNLKNGKLLTLEALMGASEKDRVFWLDFKNLRDLDDKQLADAVRDLTQMTVPLGMKSNVYIEGSDPLNLPAFRDAGFPTMFDTFPLPESHFLSTISINLYKIAYYFGDYTVMSMNYGSRQDPIYAGRNKERLGNIPVFIYHIPVNEELIDELVATPQVRVLLIGNNESVDFHDKLSC